MVVAVYFFMLLLPTFQIFALFCCSFSLYVETAAAAILVVFKQSDLDVKVYGKSAYVMPNRRGGGAWSGVGEKKVPS